MAFAPIVLFVYNRPFHTSKTLEYLQQNTLANQSSLFIFSDGTKGVEDAKVKSVREIIQKIDGFKDVTIIERKKNMGLAASVIDGVTKIVEEFGSVIVLEDDLLTSTYFLEYMNDALIKYKDEDSVMQISAHQFPVNIWKPKNTCFFLPFTTSWGWATWKDSWSKFDIEPNSFQKYLKDKDELKRFNLNDSYPYGEMLKKQMIDKSIDSWAIRWWYSVFSAKGVVLFPDYPLVENIGFGEDASHTKSKPYNESGFEKNYRIRTFPNNCKPNLGKFDVVCAYLRNNSSKKVSPPGNIKRIIDFFKKQMK